MNCSPRGLATGVHRSDIFAENPADSPSSPPYHGHPSSRFGYPFVPRFVILRHEMPAGDARGSHWDLMLECGESLRTWALDELPSDAAASNCRALADHRLAYLDYEGPISGNRGAVTRYDRGEFEIASETAERICLALRGDRLRGSLTLVRDANEPEAWSAHWLIS
jgi:hypothetical protein